MVDVSISGEKRFPAAGNLVGATEQCIRKVKQCISSPSIAKIDHAGELPDEGIAIAALDRDQRGEDRCWEARVIEIDREIFAARARGLLPGSAEFDVLRRTAKRRLYEVVHYAKWCHVGTGFLGVLRALRSA
jgi:hypothetical protein